MKPRLVVVGNPTCRRVAFWQAAAAHCQWPKVAVVSYSSLLARTDNLADVLAPDAVLRFETPAGDWDVFKRLLRHGIAPASNEAYPVLASHAIDNLEYERGWLIKPRQFYLGWVRVLEQVQRQIEASGAQSLHSASDIAILFDKPRCQDVLERAGVPIPIHWGQASDYCEVRDRCREAGRLMVKLAHGSGAAGCVALHSSNRRLRALTTVEEATCNQEPRFYSSKRIRCLDDEVAIARIIDWLCMEKIQTEQWLPKARHEGRNFDLRVVTIAGIPRHSLVRISSSIFTNLTLGSCRGDLALVKNRMGEVGWSTLWSTCARAAAAFPNLFTLGLDVLIRPDFRRHAVLEGNAFGDLLLNQSDGDESTYIATLAAWEAMHCPEGRP